MERPVIRKTSGAVFLNGVMELVADGTPEDPLKLLVWRDGKASIVNRKERNPGISSFEPKDLDPTFRRAIRFPSRADSFGSSRQLLDDICGVIKRFTNLADDHVLLAAHAVRASWLLEATDFPVTLAICGPPSPLGQRLFRVLSCLFRRALLLGEINLASLCSLPMEFSPSLFIERYDHSPQLQKVIRATRASGYIPAKGRLVRTRCSTVICSEEPLSIVIPDCNAIEIPVTDTRVSLPLLNEDAQRQVAEEFQPKLLMYRLTNHKQVMDSTFTPALSNSSVNELARCLGRCIVDDPERQADIIRLLSERDKEVEEERSWDRRVTVLEALLSLCHQENKESVYVGEVAELANSILEQRGELFALTSRTVGSQLRTLGFRTGRLDSAGRGLVLNRKVRKQIHWLAWDNKLLSDTDGEARCDDCIELRETQDVEI